MVTRRLTREDMGLGTSLVFGTSLGREYYPTEEFLRLEIERGIEEDDCHVATEGGQVVGLVWFQRRGAFRSFPYLHLIAVRDDCQGRGIGRRLMDFFEREILEDGPRRLVRTKAFLLVSRDNERAMSMYRGRGYQEVASLDGLFRKKDTEVLMVKHVVRRQPCT